MNQQKPLLKCPNCASSELIRGLETYNNVGRYSTLCLAPLLYCYHCKTYTEPVYDRWDKDLYVVHIGNSDICINKVSTTYKHPSALFRGDMRRRNSYTFRLFEVEGYT